MPIPRRATSALLVRWTRPSGSREMMTSSPGATRRWSRTSAGKTSRPRAPNRATRRDALAECVFTPPVYRGRQNPTSLLHPTSRRCGLCMGCGALRTARPAAGGTTGTGRGGPGSPACVRDGEPLPVPVALRSELPPPGAAQDARARGGPLHRAGGPAAGRDPRAGPGAHPAPARAAAGPGASWPAASVRCWRRAPSRSPAES
jgi:hypothetical protein